MNPWWYVIAAEVLFAVASVVVNVRIKRTLRRVESDARKAQWAEFVARVSAELPRYIYAEDFTSGNVAFQRMERTTWLELVVAVRGVAGRLRDEGVEDFGAVRWIAA